MSVPPPSPVSRRRFLSLSAAALALQGTFAPGTGASEAVRRRGIKLGLDNFAVRAMKWKAAQLIDYAAELRTDSLFITDLDAFDKTDDASLGDLRKKAADLAGFIRMARKGKPLEPGKGGFATEAEFQKARLERSLVCCKQALGLGLKD